MPRENNSKWCVFFFRKHHRYQFESFYTSINDLMTAPQYACKTPLVDCNAPLYDSKLTQLACNIPLPICNITDVVISFWQLRIRYTYILRWGWPRFIFMIRLHHKEFKQNHLVYQTKKLKQKIKCRILLIELFDLREYFRKRFFKKSHKNAYYTGKLPTIKKYKI